jgi:FtsP/CotA-like multicopper oxidase with cupredoxin domain
MDRRKFLAMAGASACIGAAPRLAAQALAQERADVTIEIAPVALEIAPGKTIKTTGYNGSAPGPVLRFAEGKRVTVEVTNATGTPEFVHWHGLYIPSDVDGAMEEGTPAVPPHGTRRYSFVPQPAGTRWYHSHGFAGRDMKRATYTGQYGALYVEPKNDPARYDAEVFLVLHGWDPYLSTMGEDEGALEVVYKSFSVNSRALGHGEPVRVAPGQRVMFRIVNASATLEHRLALAGHTFTVTSLDGNGVPTPRDVAILDLGPAERVDAVVTMNQPGTWILGEVDDAIRAAGLGIEIEYANSNGPAQWSAPPKEKWDYTAFGAAVAADRSPSGELQTIPLVFRHKFAGNHWVDNWTVNGKSFPKTDPIRVNAGSRYRLIFDNQSDEAHPVHLHRHSFELVKFAGKPTAGILKDVVVVPPRTQVEVGLFANNPGDTLFHCHQQLHMDFGFMTLLQYA